MKIVVEEFKYLRNEAILAVETVECIKNEHSSPDKVRSAKKSLALTREMCKSYLSDMWDPVLGDIDLERHQDYLAEVHAMIALTEEALATR